MIRHSLPANTYTHFPLQHPNIFRGSFQLLFWLVFRPYVFRLHIQKMHEFQLIFLGFILFVVCYISIFVTISFVFATPSLIMGYYLALLLGLALITLIVYESVGTAACIFVVTFFWTFLGVVTGGFYGVLLASHVATSEGSGILTLLGLGIPGIVIGGIGGGVGGFILGFIIGLFTIGIVIGIPTLASLLRSMIMAILLIPWNALLYYIDARNIKRSYSLLSKNLAFWDEWQYFPLWGLDKHLLLVLEKNPIEGQAALNYLSTSRQRWAAQSAQIELNIRQLERCTDAFEVGQIQQVLTISELSSPANTIFSSFNNISFNVNAALSQTSVYSQRIALVTVSEKLANLIQELTISSDKYAIRFRPISQRWKKVIDLHIRYLSKESELRQEIDSPYIIGVPVTNPQQLFFGRTDISERLEKLLLDRRSPPLLLHGQRRTGKTSLLNSLGRMLFTNIVPLFVDLQGSISSASSHTGFLYNLAKSMIKSAQHQRKIELPPLSYETLRVDPFTRFDEWLDAVEVVLDEKTALLTLDEFEVLDRVLSKGRFNEDDVLGLLRNIIQHRPKFKVLLAGSHTLDEFQHWSSYLINAQVIHLGYLQESEARELIERPIENFALRYDPPASQRVIDITKGHPFLVQLLCAEIVVLKNNQDPSIRRLATLADVEAAIPEALQSGSMFFSDIERNQLDAPALAVLRYCAQQGEAAIISKSALEQQFSAGLEGSITSGASEAIDLLLRRELIEHQPSGYSVQLELIRRWFIKNGDLSNET
jgi:hypothetical protein